MPKILSVHSMEFNCWLIVAFFQALIGAVTIATVAGAYHLGDALASELRRHDAPAEPRTEPPKPDPQPKPLGIPVAMQTDGR